MGNMRRIKKAMSPQIAMADVHVVVNDCKVFLGHPNAQTATASAKGFKEMLVKSMSRARCPNMHDMYDTHFRLLAKIKNGETILN